MTAVHIQTVKNCFKYLAFHILNYYCIHINTLMYMLLAFIYLGVFNLTLSLQYVYVHNSFIIFKHYFKSNLYNFLASDTCCESFAHIHR